MSTENLSRTPGHLLTVKEALYVLRVGRTKFYELVKSGDVAVVKFGERTTRVRAESIEKLLANGIA